MAYDPDTDPRLDPRLKALLPLLTPIGAPKDVAGREEMVAAAATEQALAAADLLRQVTEGMDSEEVVPQAGVRVTTEYFTSQPDGNQIPLQVIRPDDDRVLPCVYYLHGGGMATMSCTLGNYRAWGKILAHLGLVVVMPDFRNSVQPSTSGEIAPFPGGLNDCVSGLRHVHAHAAHFGIDPTRITISGESGGGNLTLATGLRLKREGDLPLVKGLYALCPYIAGMYPDPDLPSTTENNGIFLELHSNQTYVGYGPEAFESKNPEAWPLFAGVDDVTGFPPTVISVNECDPLRDEGIAFYRLLLSAGVPARGRVVLGTIHATEVIPVACPEITASTARDLADFATN